MEQLGAISNQEQLDFALSPDIGNFVRVNGWYCQIMNIGSSEGKVGHYFHVACQVWKLFMYAQNTWTCLIGNS